MEFTASPAAEEEDLFAAVETALLLPDPAASAAALRLAVAAAPPKEAYMLVSHAAGLDAEKLPGREGPRGQEEPEQGWRGPGRAQRHRREGGDTP